MLMEENSIFNQRPAWQWAVALGFFLIVLGVVAIAVPLATTVGLVVVFGAILLASGTAQLIHAFQFSGFRGRVSHFLLPVLSIIAGILTFRYPVAGAVSLTMIMTFYLLLSGFSRMSLALELRPTRGWSFILLSSIFSVALGAILLATFPVSSLLVPGLFFGVDLLFFGSSFVGYAMDLKSAGGKELQEIKKHEVGPSKAA
jgi:uncharacterized membrane protein HdeD (DUF308 family)